VFHTSDGHINVATTGDTMWRRLCKALDAEELVVNRDYATADLRLKHRDTLNTTLDEHFSKRSSAEWIDRLNKAGVPCGPIYKIDEMFADEQVKHLKMAQPIEHPILGNINVVAQAVTMSGAMRPRDMPAPERGQHTEDVLSELGLEGDEIADLRKRSIV
jgi:formyl-CoA transferase